MQGAVYIPTRYNVGLAGPPQSSTVLSGQGRPVVLEMEQAQHKTNVVLAQISTLALIEMSYLNTIKNKAAFIGVVKQAKYI